ncbi:hypothetical protein ES703_04694 [subsurface metagenome]
MKKWLSLAVSVVLCLALVIGTACGGGGEEAEEEEGVTELKFGFGLSLTGVAGAVMGIPARDAFKLGIEEIGVFEVGGEQYRWKAIFEDNLFTTPGGYSSANRLIYEHDVDVMFQSGADPGLAAEPLCDAVGMILDIAGANWDQFTPDKPYMFQVAATWAMGYVAFFDWLSQEHPEVQRIANVHTDDAMGYQQRDAVEACCDYYGLKLKDIATPLGMTEEAHLVTVLMPFKPDLIIGGVTLLGQMWDRGYDGLALSTYWLELYGEQEGWDRCEGYYITMPHPLGDPWPESAVLADEFEARFGMELVPAAYWTFMVVSVMTEALKQAGTVDDTEKILETMESRAGFETLVGPLYFGLEELNGIGHVAMWPMPIYRVTGEREYEVVKLYTAEEIETLAIEIFK